MTLCHFHEEQLLNSKEENLIRLAQYLSIDVTGLTKNEIVHILFRKSLIDACSKYKLEWQSNW